MIFRHLLNMRSHPTWVRGLKHIVREYEEGATVAPYVGAWIETEFDALGYELTPSHPTWVRGLKHDDNTNKVRVNQSHPTWVRGLKLALTPIIQILLCRTLRGCVD